VTWRRHARLVVGVVGLACAAALFVYRRDRPAVAPPPTIGNSDPKAVTENESGKIVLYALKGGQAIGTLTFKRARTYSDGRMVFDDAVFKAEGEEPFELAAQAIEAQGKGTTGEMPDEFKANGHVQVTTPSGFHLKAETGTYRHIPGIVELPGPVTFSRDRMTGSGTGAVYRKEANTVELLADARVTVPPDETGAGGLEGSSGTLVVNRADHTLHLDQNAVVRIEEQTFAGSKATVVLTPDERRATSLRLLGSANVSPVPGAKKAGPTMRGEAIDLALRPDGRTVQHATLATKAFLSLDQDGLRAPWIDLELAPDGTTVIKLDAKDGVHLDVAAAGETGSRTIDARTLGGSGTEKSGLTTARFDGDVIFVENPAAGSSSAPMKSTSRTMTLALDGGLGAIQSAEFQKTVRFGDGVVTAEAEAATYDAVKDRLVLRTADRVRPTVRDARVRLDADLFDISTKTHDMRATGGVETETLPDPAPAKGKEKQAAAVFDRSRPVRGSAPEVTYASSTSKAIYKAGSGRQAKVWQDTNVVTADEITVDDTTQNLSARRRVDTVLEMSAVGAKPDAKPTLYRIKSDEADFDQTARLATFRGKKVDFQGTDQKADGQMLEFRLAAESRTIDGFTFTGDVFATLPEGREALGDRLTYDAAKATYTLTGAGRLALAKLPAEPGSPSCSLTKGTALEFDDRGVRSAGNGAVTTQVQMPCSTNLRSLPR
jgi:lipopolysaccharide export system protein LptA